MKNGAWITEAESANNTCIHISPLIHRKYKAPAAWSLHLFKRKSVEQRYLDIVHFQATGTWYEI